MNPVRYLLVIIGFGTVTFAPTTFPDEASCKAVAATIAERSVSTVQRDLKLVCLSVPQ